MMKKLICLCLVLALAGSASAATAIWKTGAGDWAPTSNWGGSGAPSASNDTYGFSGTSSALSTITVTSTTTGATLAFFLGQPNSTKPAGVTATASQTLLIINGVMNVTRDTQAWDYKSSSSNSTVDVYGTFNAGTNSTSALNLMITSSTAALSTDVVNVRGGGTLNVAVTTGTGTGTLAVGKASGSTGTVNIYNGGTANVKTTYTVGATGTIYIENNGILWIGGDKRTTVAADIGTKLKAMNVPGTSGLTYGYDASHVLGNLTGATWVKGVPEPATIAMLGLGGLMLIRRKR